MLRSKSRGLTRLFMYLGGLVSAIAAATLIAFFLAGQPWGTYNDFSYGVLGILLLPLPVSPGLKLVKRASIIGTVSLLGLTAASFILTAQEIGLIVFSSSQPFLSRLPIAAQGVFFLLFEAWLLVLGAALKRAGMPNALKMSIIAITIVGFPVWAVWLARQRAI